MSSVVYPTLKNERTEGYWLGLMPDAELQYSITEVKKAGKILRSYNPDSPSTLRPLQWALEVFQNWRACHSVILNQFYDSLQQHVRLASPLTYVVQRPKRVEAVIGKLRRNPNAQLSTMQDIAGCRAIVKNIYDIEPFVDACKFMWSEHTLRNEYQYIDKPNPKTGYRGVHLVYAYQSRNESFNGRLIEVQIRTREQHAWATAVETVDLIQKQSLKSGHGDPRWQRFFCLMSSAIALIESRPPVPDTPLSEHELINELRRYVDDLQVHRRLQIYGAIARIVKPYSEITTSDVQDPDRSWFFLIQIDPIGNDIPDSLGITVQPYGEQEIRQAYQDMADAESAGKNVVLTAAIDFEQLREAYPNWFIDTHNFLIILQRALGKDVDLVV